jgi:alkaline phosphatase D
MVTWNSYLPITFADMQKVIRIYFALAMVVQVAVAQEPLTRIAFGSCSEEETEEQMWSDIVAQKPQLCIWLGDNIYADTHDMAFMRAQYQKQKSNPEYLKVLATCPVIGTWDDHDYGINDGGKFYSRKKESREEFLRFFDVPTNDPIRQHDGVYSSHTYGTGSKKTKVILLDLRYFRDTLYRSTVSGRRYEPNTTGDILGEAQWSWLEKELRESDATLHIIGSSIQFVAEDHGYEKWANFPAARERFIQLLRTHSYLVRPGNGKRSKPTSGRGFGYSKNVWHAHHRLE